MSVIEIVHGRPCYVCGPGGPNLRGIDVRFAWYPDLEKVMCEAVIGPDCQGAPDHAHGGALFGLLDEAMGAACWMTGHRVMSAHVDIDYRKPVRIGDRLQIAAWIERIDGRKVHTYGELRIGEVVVTQAHGLFVSSERHNWDLMAHGEKPPS